MKGSARSRKERGWDEATREWYDGHRWSADVAHGEDKTHHGLSRAVRRGTDNVAIQIYLNAAVMNLTRLAWAVAGQTGSLVCTTGPHNDTQTTLEPSETPWPLGHLRHRTKPRRSLASRMKPKQRTYSTAPLSPISPGPSTYA